MEDGDSLNKKTILIKRKARYDVGLFIFQNLFLPVFDLKSAVHPRKIA